MADTPKGSTPESDEEDLHPGAAADPEVDATAPEIGRKLRLRLAALRLAYRRRRARRRPTGVRWRKKDTDGYLGVRFADGEAEKIGRVQRFADAWFYGPWGSPHWLGPAPTRAEAMRRCEEKAT